MCMQCSIEAREGTRYLAVRVKDCCELSRGCWELNPASLKSNKFSFLMINKTEQKGTSFFLPE